MNYKRIITAAILAMSALSFAGCGGGGSTGSGAAPAKLTSGVITDISSSTQATGIIAKAPVGTLAINGVQFDVAGASIVLDNGDDPADDQLQVGMVVEIRGDHDGKKGDAREIHHENLLKGPVAAVDAAGGKLTILGQTVLVDSSTRFSGISGLAALAAGDMVKIDGLPGEGGIIQATRIHKRSAPFVANSTPVKIRGTVTSVVDQSFTIGPLQVTSDKKLPSQLSVGAFVKVEGTLSGLTGTLAASEIEVKKAEIEPEEGQSVRLEGMVTSFASQSSFMVNGITVDASALNLTGLANNVKVQVEGFITNGAIVATKVTILSTSTPPPTPTPAPAPDGAALYADNCASCHNPLASSAKKGATAAQIQSRMAAPPYASRILTAAEVQAIATALATTSPAPAPTPTPTPTPTPAPAPDGAALYAANCASCHNPLATSAKKGATATQIQTRMAAPPYASRALTTAEVQAIATVLAITTPAPAPAPTPTPTPAPLPGKAVYDANCAGCHSLGTYDAAGSAPNLSGAGTLISAKFPAAGVSGHKGITLSATNLTDIKAFVNAN